MLKTLAGAAFAAAAIMAVPAMAQTPAKGAATKPTTSAPAAATATPSAEAQPGAEVGASANSATTASANTSLSTGMSVKDSTGALIGEITDVKADASGKQVATIKMGPDAFSVESDRLAVQNGAAMINATQADLKSMLKKK